MIPLATVNEITISVEVLDIRSDDTSSLLAVQLLFTPPTINKIQRKVC